MSSHSFGGLFKKRGQNGSSDRPANVPAPQPAGAEPSTEITNPRLIDAMQGVAHGDNPETRRTLYEAMLESTFIVPTPEDVPGPEAGGWTTTQDATSFQFVTLQNAQGQSFLPVFTDVGRSSGGSRVAGLMLG